MWTLSPFSLCFLDALWTGVHTASPVPSVPNHVRALAGSCVVIPCSFTPAPPRPPKGRKEKTDVRLRFRGGAYLFPLRSTAFNSQDRDQVSRDFQGRASLVGRTADGNCSVKIERIRRDDPRVFEVALKAEEDLLWGRPTSFNLDVFNTPDSPTISGPMSAAEGQRVMLNCSVSYHCPSRPPTLQWRWDRGTGLNSTQLEETQSVYTDAHGLVLVASLFFNVSHQVKPRVKCEVNHPGIKPVFASKELHVTFAPKDVKVEVQSLTVQEGGSVLLMCSCKADPPVSEYHWSYTQHSLTFHLRHHTHTLRMYNVTRDLRVKCSARNLIGRGESQMTSLNIQYKPVILHFSSSCTLENSELSCHCFVNSNPSPVVTWSINGTVTTTQDFNVSVTSQPDVHVATLRGHMEEALKVICFAFNTVGNDSLVLLQGGEEMTRLLWMTIPAVAICLGVVTLSSLLFCWCRRRSEKRVLGRRPTVYPGGVGIYQERTPLYLNCTEVTHVYTNGSYQLVYQNCTPLFVHTKQMRPMGRRGGERRRGGEGGRKERRVGIKDEHYPPGTDADTAIYLEIL
ncbi:sialoadhesin isoform X2 [Gouania willdenowi]|uniref:sialoadhesin isoform X2 n=1 Tax=Gouania willdenowi TaxID=441366 RepID=UPI00105459BD|nr:sialoadhesin-like isoform X2 [Gouania willdenowi]